MADKRVTIDLFVEDERTVVLARSLLKRIAYSFGVRPTINERNASGGKGVTRSKFKQYTRLLQRNKILEGSPDLLVLIEDGNCSGHRKVIRELERQVDASVFADHVVGSPDPHVEKWYLSDERAISEIFGQTMEVPKDKCERAVYKSLLDTLMAGHATNKYTERELLLNLADKMDWTSELQDMSLANFIDSMKAAFTRMKQSRK